MKGNRKLPQLASGSKLKTQLPLIVYFQPFIQTNSDTIIVTWEWVKCTVEWKSFQFQTQSDFSFNIKYLIIDQQLLHLFSWWKWIINSYKGKIGKSIIIVGSYEWVWNHQRLAHSWYWIM